MPHDLIYQPKKGFVFPWKLWLKSDLKELTTARIEALKQRSFINAEELDRLWKKFLADDPQINWVKLWTLVVLENWLQENRIDE